MRLSELNKELFHLLPGFQVETDNYGQIVVYTGLMRKRDDNNVDAELVDFEEEPEIGPHVFKGSSVVDDCSLCGQRYAHESHR